MTNFSSDVTNGLESECAHSMEPLLTAKKSQDFADLIKVLNDESTMGSEKAKALYALGRWGDKAAIPSIIKALPALDEIGRVSAVDALGRLDSTDSLKAIEKLSKDTSPYVRKFTAQILLRSKKTEAARVLKTMKANETENFVRRYLDK